MTTTLAPRGADQKFRQIWESTLGVSPGGNFVEINTYPPTSIDPTGPLAGEPVLGAGFHNTVDAAQAGPPLTGVAGSLVAPLDLMQIGWFLALLFGRVTATGTTPKTHLFSTGGASLPTMAIERELKAAAQYEGMLGGYGRSIKFPLGPKAGYHAIEIGLGGVAYVEPYGSTLGGTPVVEALSNRVASSIGLLKADTVAVGGLMDGGDITFTPDMTEDRYIGNSANIGGVILDGYDCMVSLTARYTTDTLRNWGARGANLLPPPHQITQVYSLGASLSLTIDIPRVIFEPVPLKISDRKAQVVSLKGRAEVGAAAPMATLTLINSHPSY